MWVASEAYKVFSLIFKRKLKGCEPDKTLISIQTGKTAEEPVRLRHEKHLRAAPSARSWGQTLPRPRSEQRASQPQGSEKEGCWGLGEGLLCEQFERLRQLWSSLHVLLELQTLIHLH